MMIALTSKHGVFQGATIYVNPAHIVAIFPDGDNTAGSGIILVDNRVMTSLLRVSETPADIAGLIEGAAA